MRSRQIRLASMILGLAAVIPGFVREAEAQESSLYYRATLAFAVDSLVRTAPAQVNDARVKRVRDFVADPFGTPIPPTVAELNVAYEIAKTANEGNAESVGDAAFNLFTGSGASGALGALPSQTELIVGLANFMVRRAQDEVVFSFIDNLRTGINEKVEVQGVVQTVMPSSFAILQAVEPASFQVLLPQLRAAAEGDIRELPVRMGDPTVLASLGITGDQRATVQAASIVFQRVREMRGGVHPAAALANLRDLNSNSLQSEQLRTPLLVLGIVAREYSVHADSLRLVMGLLGKRQVFARYLAEDLAAYAGLAAKKSDIVEMVRARQTDLQQLVEELHQIDARVKEARAEFNADRAKASAAGAIDATLALIGGAQRYLVGNGAVPAFTFVENARVLNEAWVKRDYPAILGWFTAQFQAGTVSAPGRAQALRYMSFAASLAGAQTAEQVTVALRTAASPIGSYRLKRQQSDNENRPVAFFLTGFVGAAGGYEHAQSDADGNGGGAAHFGAALPVGLEAAWPQKNGSFSLFVPLIDVGTLASIRLGDDSVDPSPEIGFEQVFSPGVYAVWGLGRTTPAVLGLGLQSTPGLRRPSGGGSALDVWRLSLLFGIDVTLLRL